mmetsp:Transcript_48389/g.121982  ORF Transcript_48389/g.121982 Transcript_48389/m.121982 type:complete len:1293 (-) Transcript_48389:667-4545(-)
MPKKAADLVAKEPQLLDFQDLPGLLAVVAGAETSEPAEGEDAPQSLRAQIAALQPSSHEPLWQRVLDIAGEHLRGGAPAPAAAEPAAAADGEDEQPAVDDIPLRTIHAVALLLATFAENALDGSREGAALPESFAEALSLCQEMLLALSDGATQALIARALEKVCTGRFEGREDYYGGILMYLIGTCFTQRTTSADVTRLYKVRHLFPELDWEHESIESMKLQMMRCVSSPNFVRSNHGPDLMALFYTVHVGFTAEVHNTVKNQVMYARPTAVKGYAMALYKAWKASEGGTRIQVEQCVQDWVILAIRAARKSADKARAMLEELHRHHHEDHVNQLLCRLYPPVLWRSLKVANWQVRENAARFLQYIVPLIADELGVAEKEQELTRQLRMLRETLEDPAEPVRRVGVAAVCNILMNYWDMMPPAEIAELLTALRDRCARDKRAPMVRAAVAEGFACILKNPLSHPTMAAVLPQLADLLNDRSPLVRAAFVNLLDTVSHCRGVSVSNVVKNEDLLLRLASEHTEGQAERLQKGLSKKGANSGAANSAEARATPDVVAKLLAKLMVPSLFHQDLVQQVSRCHYFMKTAPLALLAMLTHAQDVIPAADRVKLAAALFRYGLREAAGVSSGAIGANNPKPKMVATMLRVVGVLLEGASEAPKKRKKGAAGAGNKFPKELEGFVYEHIREEDFLHLLKASHEDSGVAARLREDLLFALSPLEPAKLHRTADLVRFELEQAVRGGDDAATIYTLPQLTALMRTAVRWDLLGTALEAAWERLMAASKRLGRRQAAPDDVQSALAVLEAAFRDPDIRSALLKTEAEILKMVIEALAGAFCGAWSKGLTEVRAPTKAGLLLLGPAAEAWPRLIGFLVRASLHLDHRMTPTSPSPAAGVLKDVEGKEGGSAAAGAGGSADGDDAVAPSAAPEAPPHPFAGIAEKTLDQIVGTLTEGPVAEVLEALEGLPSASSAPAKKKAKLAITIPVDVDAALTVHERMLEALNAADFLYVLKLSAPRVGADGGDVEQTGSGYAIRIRALESSLWRWVGIADALQPREDGPRLPQTWTFLGRIVQQMTGTAATTPDVVSAARLLLTRVTEEVPSQDDLKKVVSSLCARLEYEPQFITLVHSIIGDEDAPAEASADDIHKRVGLVFQELLPSHRNLRMKLRPQAAAAAAAAAAAVSADGAAPSSPGHDQRRILASPTPQKAGMAAAARRSSAAAAQRTSVASVAPDPDLDGESAAESEGRRSIGERSFSVRSRSPPPGSRTGSDHLFNDCFAGREGSKAPSGSGATSGEDAD